MLTVLWGTGLEMAGLLWLGVGHMAAVRHRLGLRSPESLTGVEVRLCSWHWMLVATQGTHM